jgi:dihydroorotate dehydrogenase
LFREGTTIKPHAIDATYSDNAGGAVFGSSTGSAQSDNNEFPFLFQLLLDFALVQALGL